MPGCNISVSSATRALVMGVPVASARFRIRVLAPTRGGSGEMACLMASPGVDSYLAGLEHPEKRARNTLSPIHNFGSRQFFCPLPVKTDDIFKSRSYFAA